MSTMHANAPAMKRNLQEGLFTLPLNGRHLIEASAGTGKTYNITKLYLRLLLEKALTVQQILVMTFTKAATEELRGRIEEEVRVACGCWDDPTDHPNVAQLKANVDPVEGKLWLKRALLDMDEAAIFTIHGFCSRVLTREAFASGLPMALTMEADTTGVLQEAVRDWFRRVAQDEARFRLLAEAGWETPDKWLGAFGKLVGEAQGVVVLSEAAYESIQAQTQQTYFDQAFVPRLQRTKTHLLAHQAMLFAELVDNRKKDKANREAEWAALMAWLDSDEPTECPKAAGEFVNGNRYRGKTQIAEALQEFKDLRNDVNDWFKRARERSAKVLAALPAYQFVAEGLLTIRQSFLAEKERAQQLDFNDLIHLLADRLRHEQGDVLANLLRRQYPVALVDEFQDTDDCQFRIFDALYPQGHPEHGLFMIGDPKQAIYSFRGGDIFAYLSARNSADYQWYMETNWRSLDNVVDGYNRLFFGGERAGVPSDRVFGYGITYDWIHFSPHAKAARIPLVDAVPNRSGMTFCWLPDIQHPSGQGRNAGNPTKEDWVDGMTRWSVAEIHRLLNEATLGDRSLEERDIAILVRSGKEAETMQNALRQAGYPSVYLSDRTQIFQSEEAAALSRVLDGIMDYENDSALLRALATPLWGADARLIAHVRDVLPEHSMEDHEDVNASHPQPEWCGLSSEDAWEWVKSEAVLLREVWRSQGCLAMLMQLLHDKYRPEPAHHERALTNYLHLFELLQQAARRYRQPAQLLKWYQDQRSASVQQSESEQRLESDANLIRVVTMHGSKGLEYPVVFVPFASFYSDPVRDAEFFKYHQPETADLVYQMGETDLAAQLAREEGDAEGIRLFYVAVTRASHRCYVGVSPYGEGRCSGLGRTLGLSGSASSDWQSALQQVVETSGNCCSLLTITSETELPRRTTQSDSADEIRPAMLTQSVNDQWQLASYSMLSRQSVGTEKQVQKDRDEEGVDTGAFDRDETASLPLRFLMPKGAKTGDLLHDILEHIHFQQPEWESVLNVSVLRHGDWVEDPGALQAWMQEVLATPVPVIGQTAQPFSLGQLSQDQVLKEAEFYFPMHQVSLSALSDLLSAHRLGQQVTLAGHMQTLEGMMHGFIDLVFEWQGKYYVADYKSSWLGNHCRAYGADALQASVQHSLYDLQYLLYSLAVHRYLRGRLGGRYDPASHFGGVYYFYLRGMHPKNPEPWGIYARSVEARLLQRMDQIFQGER